MSPSAAVKTALGAFAVGVLFAEAFLQNRETRKSIAGRLVHSSLTIHLGDLIGIITVFSSLHAMLMIVDCVGCRVQHCVFVNQPTGEPVDTYPIARQLLRDEDYSQILAPQERFVGRG